jgi:hypothetical protein
MTENFGKISRNIEILNRKIEEIEANGNSKS